MIVALQAALAIGLGVLSLMAVLANWAIVLRSFARPAYSASLIPLVGGIAGCCAFLVSPLTALRWLWWLPLCIDWGCGLGLATAPFFYLWHRIRRRQVGKNGPKSV
jgi:hypothetical protein